MARENEEELTIKKVSTIADSWWKIVTILASIVFAIYQLSIVWMTISETKAELKDFKESSAKDNAFRDDRSDKRYDRANAMYQELKDRQL